MTVELCRCAVRVLDRSQVGKPCPWCGLELGLSDADERSLAVAEQRLGEVGEAEAKLAGWNASIRARSHTGERPWNKRR